MITVVYDGAYVLTDDHLNHHFFIHAQEVVDFLEQHFPGAQVLWNIQQTPKQNDSTTKY